MKLMKCDHRSDQPIIDHNIELRKIYSCSHPTATPNNSTTELGCKICPFNTHIKQVSPSVWHKLTNYSKALLKYKLAGSPEATPQEIEQRLTICKSCDRLEPTSRSCYECGCPVEEKALWATEDCPIGKWQEVRGDSETITTQQDMGKQGCGCG